MNIGCETKLLGLAQGWESEWAGVRDSINWPKKQISIIQVLSVVLQNTKLPFYLFMFDEIAPKFKISKIW